MNVFEEIAKELDKGAPWILYRQDLAAILRSVAESFGEDERMRKDAERYRWLRDRMAVEDMPEEHPSWSTPSEEESRKVDAAVDAAMREEGANAVIQPELFTNKPEE